MQDQGSWISTEDALPEDGQVVFMLCDGVPIVGSRCYSPEGWVWGNSYGYFEWNKSEWTCDSEADDDYQPTHWYPLPSPPSNKE